MKRTMILNKGLEGSKPQQRNNSLQPHNQPKIQNREKGERGQTAEKELNKITNMSKVTQKPMIEPTQDSEPQLPKGPGSSAASATSEHPSGAS